MNLKEIADQRIEKLNREYGREKFVNRSRKEVFMKANSGTPSLEQDEQSFDQNFAHTFPLAVKENPVVVHQTPSISEPKKKIEWDEELVAWFLSEKELPLTPFWLKPAVWIVDPQKFYVSLKADVELGTRSPRALFGAIQDDLRCLKAHVQKESKLSLQIKSLNQDKLYLECL